MIRLVAGLALSACAKPASPGDPLQEEVIRVPEGFSRVEAPSNFKSLRPLASAALPDGSFVIAGSAVRLVQYQWVLKVPAAGEPSQLTFDPGRIEWIADNGTAGLDAVGTLGGVPEDKAWYGEIDAFGKLGTRQTYLSDGAGQFKAMVRLADGLAAGGEVMTTDGAIHGWVVRTDHNGRDLWKTQIGKAQAQGFTWLQEQGGILVGGGWQLDTSEDPWVAAVDQSGAVILDKRWDDPAWTRLTGGVVLASGDLQVVGISAPTDAGALDGSGSLWTARVSADGTEIWDRQARTDLSVVSRGVAYKGGMAVAALRGAYGSPRKVLVAEITADGETTWTEPALPDGVTWAQLQVVDGRLVVIAAISAGSGVSYRRIDL